MTPLNRLRTNVGKRAKRRGSIIVLAAVFLVVVVAFLALSIDYGYIVVVESDLQNAADAGAMSGARALSDGREAAIDAAKTWAAKNIAAGEAVVVADEDVEIGRWDYDTATFIAIPADAAESPSAVRVTCRRTAASGNPLQLFFAPAIGTQDANLTTTAAASLVRESCGLIIGIEGIFAESGLVDSYDSSAGSYASQTPGERGHVCSDGDITQHPNHSIYGNASPGDGHTVFGQGLITGNTDPHDRPIDAPPLDPGPAVDTNDNDNIPPEYFSDTSFQDSSQPELRWSEGALVLSGQQVLTLPAGTYYFGDGIYIGGQAELQVTGDTTIYVDSHVYVGGNGIVNTSGVPSNLRMNIMSDSAYFLGGSDLVGVIYGPSTFMRFAGGNGLQGAVTARVLNLAHNNSSGMHADQSLLNDTQNASRVKLRQ